MNTLKAGFSRVDVTPMLGIGIAGYYVPRFADGVLDPLQINALALSCGEEKSMLGGATLAQNLKADAYIVLDVNFAKEQTSRDGEYLEFEKGAGISISSATSHVLTRAIFNSAKKHAHNLQRVVEMTNTGTNANIAGRKCTGTHTAVLSIPLRYMHTSVETVSVEDCFSCAEILRDFAYDCDKEFPCESLYRIKGGEVF